MRQSKIALNGSLASGKTEVAKSLVELHGYTLVNFTDYLKQLYAERYTKQYGRTLTVDQINADKENWRTALIEFGHAIGFDTDPKFVSDAVAAAGNPDYAVFDNVRYRPQMDELAKQDYRLVRLYVPQELLKLRLMVYKGLTEDEAQERLCDPVEHAMDDPFPGEYEVSNYDRTPDDTSEQIASQMYYLRPMRPLTPGNIA